MSCCLRRAPMTRLRWQVRAQGQEVCAQALERTKALQKYRERLAALVGVGQAKQYLGKAFTIYQIDVLDDAEIEKLYARYDAARRRG